MKWKLVFLYLLIESVLFSESVQTPLQKTPPPQSTRTSSSLNSNTIQQRITKPQLLGKQSLFQNDAVETAIKMNLGQNPGDLPGSGFIASQKIFPRLTTTYENKWVLPSSGENVALNRYLHQNKIDLEWNFLSQTSLRGSALNQKEWNIQQETVPLSEMKQNELGLKGTLLKRSFWELGYRITESEFRTSTLETNLWYANWRQPVYSDLSLFLKSQYSEQGDPTRDYLEPESHLNLGIGTDYKINPQFSARLGFNLQMQQESLQREWTPEEKRINFSLKGTF